MKPRKTPQPDKAPQPRGFDADTVDPVQMGVEISKLPPNHPLVAAARSGAEVSQMRHERQVAVRDASKDVAEDKTWQGYAARHLPHEEVERRRYAPSGDRDLWVKYGQAGPPAVPPRRQPSEGLYARAREACDPANTEPAPWAAAQPSVGDGAGRARCR